MVESVAGLTRGRRYNELRAMLEQRSRELSSQIKRSIRDGRTQDATAGSKAPLINDSSEVPDATVEGELDLALTELRAEMLNRVAAALSRLDEGKYGCCAECGGEIPEPRLKAMPFAIRCRNCESAREEAARLKSAVSRDRLMRTFF
jgi:DnaK suppressor protein